MSKKLLRNVAILVTFCVGLIVLIQLGNWLLAQRYVEPESDGLGETRRLANVNLRRERFEPAIRYFNIVLNEDPYDGHAAYGRACAYRIKYYSLISASEPDPTACQQAADEAIQQFEYVLDFPRYRNRARHSMSMIHAYQGDFQQAHELMREAINDGYVSDGNNFLNNPTNRFYYGKMLRDSVWGNRLQRLQAMELRNFSSRTQGIARPQFPNKSKSGDSNSSESNETEKQ